MAGMIIRALGFSDIETGKGPFSDTDDPYITSAYDFDIISGKSETIFSPDSLASREESLLARMFGINKISIWRIGQITNDVWAAVENMKTP